MKIANIILISLIILANASIILSKMPDLKFITKFNDVSLQNKVSTSINLGDTLLFTYEDSEVDVSYLNICFDNKCLQFTNLEMGIPNKKNIKLHDAVHVNKNNNELWFITHDGLFIYDGIEIVRNENVFNELDPPSKSRYRHSLYKHNNGDIYISSPYINLIKYDGIKYDTIIAPISDEEMYIKTRSPQTNLVAFDNKLYFFTLQFDLAYLDIETQEYHYPFIKDTIINNFLSDEELLPFVKPMINGLLKNGDKLFLHIDKLLISSFFYYDGENIEKVELDRDLIFPNDSSYQIYSIYIDSKLRKWCYIASQRSLYEPYDKKNHYFIIDKDNNYFRIDPEKYGFNQYTNFSGLHEFSNGATYLGLSGGFLVDDPLGVSVTESAPSFFLNKVRPNPFKDKALVELTATRAAINNMKVEIFDYLGKSIKQIEPFITYQPLNGHAVLELETEGIRPGYYYLVLTDHNDTRTMPILIK
jgi:hypothetical protein